MMMFASVNAFFLSASLPLGEASAAIREGISYLPSGGRCHGASEPEVTSVVGNF